MYWSLIIALVLVSNNRIQATECPTDQPKIICYYSSWAYYRDDIGYFDTNNIDTSLCTHIVYSFAGLNVHLNIDSLDPNVDMTRGGFRNFTDLKIGNPCLKTILAVGGWNEGSRKYSVMASTAASRDALVEGALRFLAMYNFDGLDVDWEYPGQRGGIAEDKENFAIFLKALHARFQKWGLEISLAAPIIASYLEEGYDVAEITKYVSHVSLMAYDYTATTSETTGWMAPLPEIKKSIKLWLDKGLPKEKLILGLPSYARSYKLLNADDHGIGARTDGIGRSGEYTNETGFLAYYEFERLLQTGLYESECDDGNCYAYYKSDWFSYDSDETYNEKLNYVVDNKLGGVMLWTLDTDDFGGIYGEPYPVLNAIKNKLSTAYRLKHRN